MFIIVSVSDWKLRPSIQMLLLLRTLYSPERLWDFWDADASASYFLQIFFILLSQEKQSNVRSKRGGV